MPVCQAQRDDRIEMDHETSKRCLKLLKTLMKKEMATIFSEPVSREDYPEYYTMIDKPMDFGTIVKRLRKSKYGSVQARIAHRIPELQCRNAAVELLTLRPCCTAVHARHSPRLR